MAQQPTVMDWINDEVNKADHQMSSRDRNTNGWIVFHSRKDAIKAAHKIIKSNLVDPLIDERELALTTMMEAGRAGDRSMANIAMTRAEAFKTVLKMMGYPVEDLPS